MLLKFDAEILIILAVDKSWKTCKKYNNRNCYVFYRAASELISVSPQEKKTVTLAGLLAMCIVSFMLLLGV